MPAGTPPQMPFDQAFDRLVAIIKAQQVLDWVLDKIEDRSQETLTYLTKFAYMTGVINKGDIKRFLGVDSKGAKALVKQWYDDHREKGCGTC